MPWVRRAGQTAGDLGDMAVGKKVKDPFYEKSWFKRAAQTAAIAAPLGLYATGIHHRNRSLRGEGQAPGMAGKVGAWSDRTLRKFKLSANPLIVALNAHHRIVTQFDYIDKEGWDLRDARGKSARVFAPGSKKRDRREKTTSEKVSTIRAVRNLAIAGTVAGAAGTLIYRNKWKSTPQGQGAPGAVDSVRDLFRKKATDKLKAMSGRVRTVNFAKPTKEEQPSKLRTAAKVAGVGLIGAGALALPAAIPMLKIQGRRMTPGASKDPAAGGKFVNDYLTASRRGLNRGPQGVVAGKVIQGMRVSTKPGTKDRFMADHYARFRAGDKQALGHWGYEVGESLYQSGIKKGMTSQAAAGRMRPFLSGQMKVNKAMDNQMNNKGRNESEALKAVSRNTDPEVQGYFRRLAAHKTGAVKRRYGPLATIPPAAIAAGAGLLAASRKKKEDQTEFAAKRSSVERVIGAVGDNVSLPDRPELPGEGAVRVIVENPRARNLFLRTAGSAAAIGGGYLIGKKYKHPTLGAGLGGFGAGALLT